MQDSTKTKSEWVWVSDSGALTGESHPGAVLSNADVESLLALREADPRKWSLQKLADKFNVSKSCVWKIVNGRRRGGVAWRVRASAARR